MGELNQLCSKARPPCLAPGGLSVNDFNWSPTGQEGRNGYTPSTTPIRTTQNVSTAILHWAAALTHDSIHDHTHLKMMIDQLKILLKGHASRKRTCKILDSLFLKMFLEAVNKLICYQPEIFELFTLNTVSFYKRKKSGKCKFTRQYKQNLSE